MELQETADQVNELEQYSRKQCINVNGVPEKQNENVAQLVLEIARAAGAELSPSDVDAAHRVGRPRDGKHRAIIVRFVSFTARQRVYDRRRELRDLTAERGPQSFLTTAELKNVFISDSLTKRNEETMHNARQLKKERKIWAAWTDNGKMKIKLEKNAPTKIIRSTQNMRDLVGDGPDAAPRAGGPGAASAAGGSGRADLSRGNEGSARGRRLLPVSRQLPPRLGVRGRQTERWTGRPVTCPCQLSSLDHVKVTCTCQPRGLRPLTAGNGCFTLAFGRPVSGPIRARKARLP